MMMNNYLLEPFLASFYLAEAVCRHFISETERSRIFAELADVFCIPESRLAEYYRESGLPHYRNISNLSEYNRFCRTLEFMKFSGKEIDCTGTDRLIMSQKCIAMKAKQDILESDANITRAALYRTLSDVAELGCVNAMTLLAFLEYNGICFSEAKNRAIVQIRKAAEWNDLFACLMGIAYDVERTYRYSSILNTVLSFGAHRDAYAVVCARNSLTECSETNPEAELLERAFSYGSVKRDIYNRYYAEFLGSEIVSYEDKKKLVNSEHKDITALISKIPFSATFKKKPCFDRSAADRVLLRRDEELRSILRHVAVATESPGGVSKPLMIASSSGFVCDMYRDMLRDGFAGSGVVEIDAGSLNVHDLDPTSDNVFLRGVLKTGSARTVFMIHGCEELEDHRIEALTKWFSTAFRKNFELYNPHVTLDFSGLMIILFATAKVSEISSLTSHCETVFTDRVKNEEKRNMIEVALSSALEPYDSVMSMSEECMTFLEGYDANRIVQIIEFAVRNAVYEGRDEIILTDVKEGGNNPKVISTAGSFGFNGGNNNA